jgi:DNA-binding XRE family transcriptional regulator
MRLSPQRHTLAVLRTLIGFTQKEMAHILECSVPTVQAVELGKLKLSLDLAQRVQFQTGVCTEWLLADDVTKPPVTGRGEPYTKALFEEWQSILLSPKPTSTGAIMELWKTWHMFIKHTKLLAILYSEAYKRGKVPLVFYKSLRSTQALMEKAIGQDKSVEEKLAKLTYHQGLDPENVFELTETLADFEADTYEELQRKLKQKKETIPIGFRAYMREYDKRLLRARKKTVSKCDTKK